MSLLDRRYGLLVGLALLLFSCEEPNEIGLSINPEDQVGVYYVDLPVEASMVYTDSIITGGSGRLLTGLYNDPVFGKTAARAFTQVRLNRGTPNAEAVYDSATLYLQPDYFYGENKNKPQRFSIHKINSGSDTLYFNKPYYSKDRYDHYAEVLGTGEFVIDLDDSISIPMDEALGRDLFNKAKGGSDILDYDSLFYPYFDGLAIIADPSNEAIVGFDASSGASRLRIHYHVGTGDDTDTLALDFPINRDNSFNIPIPHFSYITSDRSSGIVPQREVHEEFTLDGNIYAQAGTGLVTKLKFDSFKEFMEADSVQNIIINSGEFIMSGVDASSENLDTPEGLRFYLTDDTNKRIIVRERDVLYYRSIQQNGVSPFTSSSPLVLNYNEHNSDYFGHMTLFLQALRDGEMDYEAALIYPSEVGSSVNHYITKTSDIKLRLYYTRLK